MLPLSLAGLVMVRLGCHPNLANSWKVFGLDLFMSGNFGHRRA